MFLLSNAVTFTGIDDQFGLHFVPFQSPIKLLALSDGIRDIVLAAENECRSLALLTWVTGERSTKSSRFS